MVPNRGWGKPRLWGRRKPDQRRKRGNIMNMKRWTTACVRTAGLVAMLARALVPHAQQSPPAQCRMINDSFYPNDATFYLPVHMDQRTRDTCMEVCLYVKSGGADWVSQEVPPSSIKSSPFTVPQDGEYSF